MVGKEREMKVWIVKETGEVRRARNGEIYEDDGFFKCKSSDGTVYKHPIISSQVIEIPNDSTSASVHFLSGSRLRKIVNIDLPTKPKVKKWKWRCIVNRGGTEGIWITEKYYTEDEIQETYGPFDDRVSKVPGSEIEE
jgi:hypothetical protein